MKLHEEKCKTGLNFTNVKIRVSNNKVIKKSITPPFETLSFWVINHLVENELITYDVITYDAIAAF